MDKNKYIDVINRYYRLLKQGTITSKTAWWGMHAVVLCAQKDDRLSGDEYCYILEYGSTFFE